MKLGYEYFYTNTETGEEEYYFFESAIKGIEFGRANPHLVIKTIISEGVIIW